MLHRVGAELLRHGDDAAHDVRDAEQGGDHAEPGPGQGKGLEEHPGAEGGWGLFYYY